MTRVFQTEVDPAELQPGDIVISLVDNRGEIRVAVEREVPDMIRHGLGFAHPATATCALCGPVEREMPKLKATLAIKPTWDDHG